MLTDKGSIHCADMHTIEGAKMSFKYVEIKEGLPEGVEIRYEVIVTGPNPDQLIGSVDKKGNTDWRWTGDPQGKSYRTRVAAAGTLFDVVLADQMTAAQQPHRDAAGGTVPTTEGVAVVPSAHPPQAPLPTMPQVDPSTYANDPNPLVAADGAGFTGDVEGLPSSDQAADADAFGAYPGDVAAPVEPSVDEDLAASAEMQLDDTMRAELVDLITQGADPTWATSSVKLKAYKAQKAALAEAQRIADEQAAALATSPIDGAVADALTYQANQGAVVAGDGDRLPADAVVAYVSEGVYTIAVNGAPILSTRNARFAADSLFEHLGKVAAAQREQVTAGRSDTWP